MTVADSVRDEEVALLKRGAARTDGSGAAGAAADTAAVAAPDPPGFEREITWTAGDLELAGHLAIPDRATGAVIFAQGSGSSRRSPRNRFVAARSTRLAWARCWPTCSRQRRNSAAPTCSTCGCSRHG